MCDTARQQSACWRSSSARARRPPTDPTRSLRLGPSSGPTPACPQPWRRCAGELTPSKIVLSQCLWSSPRCHVQQHVYFTALMTLPMAAW